MLLKHPSDLVITLLCNCYYALTPSCTPSDPTVSRLRGAATPSVAPIALDTGLANFHASQSGSDRQFDFFQAPLQAFNALRIANAVLLREVKLDPQMDPFVLQSFELGIVRLGLQPSFFLSKLNVTAGLCRPAADLSVS